MKNIFKSLLCLSIFVVAAQEVSPPTTPPATPAFERSRFFHRGDDSTDSSDSSALSSAVATPLTSATSSPISKQLFNMITPLSAVRIGLSARGSRNSSANTSPHNSPEAKKLSSKFGPVNPSLLYSVLDRTVSPNNSPGKRYRDEAPSFESRAKRSKNASVADLLDSALASNKKDKRTSVLKEIEERLSNSYDLTELEKHFISFKEKAFNAPLDSQNRSAFEDLIQMPLLRTFVRVAHEKAFDTRCFNLPLIHFEHLENPDNTGGYHIQNKTYPVQVSVKNPQTGIYGGTFKYTKKKEGQDSETTKYSSFFPEASQLEDILPMVTQAYNQVICSENNRRLGQSANGTYIEMLLEEDKIEAKSVFPIVAYVDATQKNATLNIDIEDGAGLKNHLLTQAQIIGLVKKAKEPSIKYNLSDAKVVDIGQLIADKIRSIYVKILNIDLK